MTHDPILSRVEDALKVHHFSVTRFGYLVAGDPTLVRRMRAGRKLRAKLRQKVESALAKLEQDGEL